MDSQLPRILDANANRAREGLRTAEDYARFILNDLNFAENLRIVRQGLTTVLLSIPQLGITLLESRNVVSDPLQPENWTDNVRSVEAEAPVETAQRGLKRAQEALRVLEEYLRASHPQAAAEFSKFRYSAYELEQRLIGAGPSMRTLSDAKVYVLLAREYCRNGDVLKTAQDVLEAGVKVIQLREKTLPDVESLPVLRSLSVLCREFGAVLFSNDRVDLALLGETHGVHLGQTDLSPCDARRLSGRRLVIGKSTHSPEQARHAVEVEKADYIGIGAMYNTSSKAKPLLKGLILAEEVASLNLNVPVFAIGGITLDRIKDLKSAGVTRVAITQAIIGSDSPGKEARKFVEAMAT